MPKVSVIMPCHNGAKYIAGAIHSVQNQTFSDWELLVIDDCSTDDSLEIIRRFTEEDRRIRFLQTEQSTGFPSDVRNAGIQAAIGRYIAFLDCDDKWLPTKLENQLPLFEDENVAVVFSWYKKMDENGSIHQNPVKSPAFVTYKKLLGGNVIGNLTGIYDSKKVGNVFQKQIHHEDYLMWLEILNKGFSAMNTNTIEALYRESNESISGSKLKAFMWTWQIFHRELQLSFVAAIICFIRYAFKGMLKFWK